MKKAAIIILICALAMTAAGCKRDSGYTCTFDATVTQVGGSRITVTTDDEAVSFTEANVSFVDGVKMSFTPAVGQTVRLTITPDESGSGDVPNVTAVKIELISR